MKSYKYQIEMGTGLNKKIQRRFLVEGLFVVGYTRRTIDYFRADSDSVLKEERMIKTESLGIRDLIDIDIPTDKVTAIKEAGEKFNDCQKAMGTSTGNLLSLIEGAFYVP